MAYIRKTVLYSVFSGLLASLAVHAVRAEDWKPAKGPLMTRWAKDVSPTNALPDYPRPQFERADWLNLNGLWQLEFGKDGDPPPTGQTLSKQILVPFPVESALSGVMEHSDRLWYRRQFQVPQSWSGRRVLLHFGAVDWETTVWVNGKELGFHKGGFDGFSFDITPALKEGVDQELIVGVWDPTDAGTQPRGKQALKPEGIFYTPTTGIWQTVWLEPVNTTHIESIKIVPDLTHSCAHVSVLATSPPEATSNLKARLKAMVDGKEVAAVEGIPGSPLELKIASPKLWSPDRPFLYDLVVELVQNGTVVDTARSYFGMRDVKLATLADGMTRIMLNNQFVVQMGPLDQGFWPDGLYTPPTEEALKYDIEITKKLGFNTTRKHVKVEPDRWYYWCDKLGLLVWQDMPSGDRFIGPNDPDITRSPESAKQYEVELKAMIDGLHNHPSIILWVVFNEGWGQFDTARIAEWTKQYDPTRLVDSASGWTDRGVGDMHDMHNYPGPGTFKTEPTRAAVLGEFGGLGLGVDGHNWTDKTWGYQGMASKADLTRKYLSLIQRTYALSVEQGMSAAIYTQLTDVETEANGLLTYDREVIKVDLDRVARANQGDLSGIPIVKPIVPTAREQEFTWSYSTISPPEDWFQPTFDATGWKQGPGGFGTKSTPGATVRTDWDSGDIWLRGEFTLPDLDPAKLLLLVHHDEDAEAYINGVLAAKLGGFTSTYEEVGISPEAQAVIKPGKNTVAVHCHQTSGGQYIDLGFSAVQEPVAK